MSTTYSDYLRDRTGWFFGLTGLQLTLLAIGGLPVWLTVNAARWSWLLLWIPFWLLLTFLVVVPVRGWTAAQWIGVLASHAMGGAMGWTRWQSKVAAGIADDLDLADLPGVLAGIEIHAGPPYAHHLTRVAVIQDHAPPYLGGHRPHRASRAGAHRAGGTRPDGSRARGALRGCLARRAGRADHGAGPHRAGRRR